MSDVILKVLILGAGYMGTVHAAMYKKIPGVEIAGIVDSNIVKCKALAEEYSTGAYAQMDDSLLQQADFIDICLPTWMHKPIAFKAFAAGKDVLCEKPISIDTVEAEEITHAAEVYGRKFMVAHVVRYWPEYSKLYSMIKNNEIINLRQITFSRFGPAPAWSEGNWMLMDDKSGGIIYDLAIHDIDFCIWAFGMPKWVFARRSVLAGSYTDYVNAILGYDNMNVLLESGFIYEKHYPFTAGFRIAAEKATYEYVNKSHKGLVKFTASEQGEKLNYPDYDPYQKEIESFINYVRSGISSDICTGNDALNAIKLAELIKKSAIEEKKMEVL